MARTTTPYLTGLFKKVLVENNIDYVRVILFGSRAQGYDKPTSDIDLCLVLPGGPAQNPEIEGIAKMLRIKLGMLGVNCDLLVFHEAEFESNSISPILRQIKKTGKIVAHKNGT